jgi:hypothetical protein
MRGVGSTLRGRGRGSRAGRFREARLRRVLLKAPTEFGRTPLLAYGAAFDGVPVPARPQPAGQNRRSQGSRAVPWLRCAGASHRVDQSGPSQSPDIPPVLLKRDEPMLTHRGLGFDRLSLPGQRGGAQPAAGSTQFQHIGRHWSRCLTSDPFRFQKYLTKPRHVKAFVRFLRSSLKPSLGSERSPLSELVTPG